MDLIASTPRSRHRALTAAPPPRRRRAARPSGDSHAVVSHGVVSHCVVSHGVVSRTAPKLFLSFFESYEMTCVGCIERGKVRVFSLLSLFSLFSLFSRSVLARAATVLEAER